MIDKKRNDDDFFSLDQIPVIVGFCDKTILNFALSTGLRIDEIDMKENIDT